ncbi:hypothetical protein CDAR_98171 [Caerostris darwini]|uniref:Uncharacterized protein n=1 Tax=Caerostris darwini TaxID=1538125 RepID=A0AAV4UFR9_9ARAC|nr:hypothetical protein CDAR_98171 [Caerostris darwini]
MRGGVFERATPLSSRSRNALALKPDGKAPAEPPVEMGQPVACLPCQSPITWSVTCDVFPGNRRLWARELSELG